MTKKHSDDPIGQNLRAKRTLSGLSLQAVSDRTGVSKAMLGQIERGESSPTLATLWKLCKGLQLPLTALISPGAQRAAPPAEGPEFTTLFPFDPRTGCEVFMHNLAPQWEHLSEPHSDGVIEDVYVIEGALEILINADWQRVEAGEALRFAADQPHGYRNPLSQRTRFHNTIYYPLQPAADWGQK